eukprot:3723923-Amphidinium_carterae.1
MHASRFQGLRLTLVLRSINSDILSKGRVGIGKVGRHDVAIGQRHEQRRSSSKTFLNHWIPQWIQRHEVVKHSGTNCPGTLPATQSAGEFGDCAAEFLVPICPMRGWT